MSTLYGTGVHRIVYKAGGFATGKTVTAYIWSPSLVKSIQQNLIEVSDGLYYLDYIFSGVGTYFGEFYENAVAMTMGVFRVETELLATGIVTVVSPVSADGTDLTITRGDDYKVADSRAIEFTSATWPSIVGGTVKLSIRLKKTEELELEVAGTVVDAATCRFDLTHALTDIMTVSNKGHYFDVEAILAGGSYITLALGNCTVLKDVTRNT